MLVLDSLVSCVFETAGARSAGAATERSRAGDISAVAAGETKGQVRRRVRHFSGAAGGGEVNLGTCFAFGDSCVSGVIGEE
eukprot:2203337-Pyramimonas_sp.AAC.1